jgi:hypothetical protein
MNFKVAGFMMTTLGIMGVSLSGGMIHGKYFSKEACVSSISRQADKDIFSDVDPGAFCGCLVEHKITLDNSSLDSFKPCLDNHLKDPIVNACEKDEAEKVRLRDHRATPEEEMTDSQPIGPSMNCECVYDRSAEWIWKNFDAALHSKIIAKDEASRYASDIMNECKWK